jgi:hypothetical protein
VEALVAARRKESPRKDFFRRFRALAMARSISVLPSDGIWLKLELAAKVEVIR